MRRKRPLLALILSMLIPGLGQVYNGQIIKGAILAVFYLIIWSSIVWAYFAASAITFGLGLIICLPIFLVPLAVVIYAMFDAYRTAKWINRS